MACFNTQPLKQSLFETLIKFIDEHGGSPRSADAAYEIVHSFSLALRKVGVISQDLPSVSGHLADSLDWIERTKSN
jgi:hypothetical protein